MIERELALTGVDNDNDDVGGEAPALAELLACPDDGGRIVAPSPRMLQCAQCGREYPIEEGVARMLSPAAEIGDLAAQEMRARDAQAPDYDRRIPRGVQLVETEAIMRRLRLARGQVVLDAGAGTGKLTHAAAAAGATVVAVDFSVQSLLVNRDRARPDRRIHFVAADIRRLPVRPGSFDRVISGQVIEHLPTHEDREQAVALMSRALRPGGWIVLTAYNYNLGARLAGQREGAHHGGIFFHRFTPSELRAMFAGLEIDELCGIRNLPARVADAPWRTVRWIDHAAERLPCSRLTGDLLLVAGRKPL